MAAVIVPNVAAATVRTFQSTFHGIRDRSHHDDRSLVPTLPGDW